MRRLCLDTSAYANFKAGDSQSRDTITEAKVVGVPVVVLGELRAGFRLGKRYDENEAELRAFLASPPVQTWDIDDEASYHYAEIFAQLRRQGTHIPTNDLWIAALSLREGAIILTFDAHFDLIRQVGTCLLRTK